MKYSLNQKVNHVTHGTGTIVEIEERTFAKDGIREPLLWVEFENVVRQDKEGNDVYKILFNETSLTDFTTE